MKKLKLRWAGVAFAAYFACLGLTQTAQAVVLAPPQAALPTGVSGWTGDVLAVNQTEYKFDASGSAFTATVLSLAVYRQDTKTMDFYYQIQNSASSPHDLRTFTLVNFAGWTTDVDYRTDGLAGLNLNGHIIPTLAGPVQNPLGVSNSGTTISFSFEQSVIAQLDAGEVTPWLVVRTNAPGYDFEGIGSLIDGGTSSHFTFQPSLTPAPEPSTALFGLALVGMVGLARRRAQPVQA